MIKRKKSQESSGAPEWMATFSDLVTLLFCFFVLLYSMSNIDIIKFQAITAYFKGTAPPSILDGGADTGITEIMGNGIVELPIPETNSEEFVEQSQNIENEINSMAADFKTYLEENNYKDRVDIIKSDNYVELIFKDGIFFDKGKDILKQEAIVILNQIADLLLEKYSLSDIEITGHTDNDPINVPRFPDNWYLSAARAINVGNFFINQKGFSPKKISAKGRGEFDPIVPNENENNKSKNRRVEIRIFSGYYINN